MPHQCTGCGHAFEDGSKEMLSGCPECGGNKFQFRPQGAALPEDPDPPGDAPGGTEPPDSDNRSAVADPGSVAETVGRATTKVRDFVSTNPDPAGTDAATSPDPDRSWPSEVDDGTSSTRNGPASDDPASDDPAPDSPRSDDPAADDTATGDPASGGSAADGPADTDTRTGSDGEIIDADARRDEDDGPGDDEDVAQASARTDVVTNDELNDVAQPHETGRAGGDRTSTAPADPGAADMAGADAAADPEQPAVDGDAEVVSGPTGDDPDLSELREQLNDQFESIKIVEPGQYELNLMELYDREEYIIALQENGRYVIQVPDQWIGDDLDDR